MRDTMTKVLNGNKFSTRTHVTHFESFTMIQNEYNQIKGELSIHQSYEEIDCGLMDNNETIRG
jgi:hypothetical protein